MNKSEKEKYREEIREEIIKGSSYYEILSFYKEKLKKTTITRLFNESLEDIESNKIDDKIRLRAILNHRYNFIYKIATEEGDYELAIETLKGQQKLNRLETEDEVKVSFEDDKKLLSGLLGIE